MKLIGKVLHYLSAWVTGNKTSDLYYLSERKKEIEESVHRSLATLNGDTDWFLRAEKRDSHGHDIT